jgi:hypothetical protein
VFLDGHAVLTFQQGRKRIVDNANDWAAVERKAESPSAVIRFDYACGSPPPLWKSLGTQQWVYVERASHAQDIAAAGLARLRGWHRCQFDLDCLDSLDIHVKFTCSDWLG